MQLKIRSGEGNMLEKLVPAAVFVGLGVILITVVVVCLRRRVSRDLNATKSMSAGTAYRLLDRIHQVLGAEMPIIFSEWKYASESQTSQLIDDVLEDRPIYVLGGAGVIRVNLIGTNRIRIIDGGAAFEKGKEYDL